MSEQPALYLATLAKGGFIIQGTLDAALYQAALQDEITVAHARPVLAGEAPRRTAWRLIREGGAPGGPWLQTLLLLLLMGIPGALLAALLDTLLPASVWPLAAGLALTFVILAWLLRSILQTEAGDRQRESQRAAEALLEHQTNRRLLQQGVIVKGEITASEISIEAHSRVSGHSDLMERTSLYAAVAIHYQFRTPDARIIRDSLKFSVSGGPVVGEFEANAAEKLSAMRAHLQQRCAASYAPPPGTAVFVLYLDDAHYRLL